MQFNSEVTIPNYDYYVDNKKFRSADCVKDLGVHIDSNLSFTRNVDLAVSQAQRLSGLVFRTIRSREPDVLVPIFKSLVRPSLEYTTAVWNPRSVRHVEALEKVQRRFTKRIH